MKISEPKGNCYKFKIFEREKNRDFNYITIMDGDGEDNPNNKSYVKFC